MGQREFPAGADFLALRLGFRGADRGTRTRDLLFTKQLLYH